MPFTGNVTAVLGKGFAAEFGRKVTASDITPYNHKLGDCILSFVEPSAYPEKVQSLVSSFNMADQVVLKVESVDSYLAECIVALDALGMNRGHLVFSGKASPDSVRPLLAGTVVSSYEVLENQVMAVKERLASLRYPTAEEESVKEGVGLGK
ncbi:MAG: hypothetical protein V1744_05490 [Candidatus Altiarchaeota archaeon]